VPRILSTTLISLLERTGESIVSRWKTAPPNKGMKQTKPAQAMELRSLSPVLDRPVAGLRNDVSTEKLPLPEQGCDAATGLQHVAKAAAHSKHLRLMSSSGNSPTWPAPENRLALQRGPILLQERALPLLRL
jgi:hypothetical protein